METHQDLSKTCAWHWLMSPLLHLTSQSKSHGQAKHQLGAEIDSAIRKETLKSHDKVETKTRGRELAPMMRSATVRFPIASSPSSLYFAGSPGLKSCDTVGIGLFDVLFAH